MSEGTVAVVVVLMAVVVAVAAAVVFLQYIQFSPLDLQVTIDVLHLYIQNYCKQSLIALLEYITLVYIV